MILGSLSLFSFRLVLLPITNGHVIQTQLWYPSCITYPPSVWSGLPSSSHTVRTPRLEVRVSHCKMPSHLLRTRLFWNNLAVEFFYYWNISRRRIISPGFWSHFRINFLLSQKTNIVHNLFNWIRVRYAFARNSV